MRDQTSFEFSGKRKTALDRTAGYDASNLRCARVILANRSKYDTPTTGCMILWAETVTRRLGANSERLSQWT